ncbi:hypothetical protein KM043_018831 [Ampulex compressa]|nr:hypothetical protein KM043_018831 [Ampulex compressa]
MCSTTLHRLRGVIKKDAVFISAIVANIRPFIGLFSFGNRKNAFGHRGPNSCAYDFGCNGTIVSQQKFVHALNNMGQVLSQLVDKALYLNHNKEIIIMLLTRISSWSNVQNMLKYYIPEAIMHNLSFPISEDQWLQLVQRITNFGEDNCKNNINKFILHRFKISQNIFNERRITLNILIRDLENV